MREWRVDDKETPGVKEGGGHESSRIMSAGSLMINAKLSSLLSVSHDAEV